MANGTPAHSIMESIHRSDDEMHRQAAEMHKTTIVTRELIDATRARLREADRLLRQQR